MSRLEKKPVISRSGWLRVLLVAVPAALLFFSILMLVRSGSRPRAPYPDSPAEMTPGQSPVETASTSPSPKAYKLNLKAFSTSGDLYAFVVEPDGETLPDGTFLYTVVSPDGSTDTYPAESDGSLYLTQLESGLYTVRISVNGEFAALPAAIEVLSSHAAPVSEKAGFQTIDGQTYYFDRNGNAVTGLREIGGKLYYFNLYGVKASKLGIDVSYHNKGINWHAVKAHGIDFAILRVGYRGWESGLLWEDERFVQNLRGARRAGIDIGVYIYSTAVNPVEARQEADMIVGLLAGTKLEYPVYFDTEQSGDYPLGRADRLAKADRTAIVRAFCDRLRDAGYTPGVYSGLNFLKNHIERPAYAPYTTWLANYTRYNRLPDFPYHYDMWQFTDSGHVSGIRGIVDMNVIY